MTRETKIGLLVGLAFIIVVAILLSDPVNNASEPPAPIADTAGMVRQGLTVPAPSSPAAGDRTSIAIITPARSLSREPVLLPTEATQQTAQTEVKVGPPAGQPLKPIIPVINTDDAQVGVQPPVTPASHTPQDALQQVAAAGGEPVGRVDQHDPAPVGPADPADAPTGKKHYTAEAGDTVSKMAGRLMGANTRANRAAIIAANPSLIKNPNRVIVGANYVIPVSSDSATPAPTPADVVQSPAPTEKPAGRWYVVKPNDSLWRIATAEVGDASAVSEIISLNKDILKGGSTIHPDMKLRLPPKTVASAE